MNRPSADRLTGLLDVVAAALDPHFERSTVDALTAPVRAAIALPPDARDAEALAEALEQLDEMLELYRLILPARGGT